MQAAGKPLGVMRPLGGGDPIPMKKDELYVGRRPKCDIRLDFENISGKHCLLRYIKGTWHVRDLGSTNGTTVNGQRITSEHGLMPDDELGIAGHFFMLDYDPVAPTSLMDANHILEEEMSEGPRPRSLMELAGLESDNATRASRPQRAPERIVRPTSDEDEFGDSVPIQYNPDPKTDFTDDDFLKMVQEDLKPKKKS